MPSPEDRGARRLRSRAWARSRAAAATTQIEAVGSFFEAVGLAFQIIDDVLNLRGFKGNLKQRGEDIANGTVTLPVAKAMARLPRDKREWLWETLQSKPTDDATSRPAIELVRAAARSQRARPGARARRGRLGARPSRCSTPSLARVMLRAFGWYVLERHY